MVIRIPLISIDDDFKDGVSRIRVKVSPACIGFIALSRYHKKALLATLGRLQRAIEENITPFAADTINGGVGNESEEKQGTPEIAPEPTKN